MLRRSFCITVLLVGFLILGCNTAQEPQEDIQQGTDHSKLSGPLLGTGLSYTLVPNEDLTPLDWGVIPTEATNHYSLIDEETPLDSEYLRTSTWSTVDKWGFTDVGNPNPYAYVTGLTVHIYLDVDLGVFVDLVTTIYIGGGVFDSEEICIQESGPYHWTLTYSGALFFLGYINTLKVAVEYEEAAGSPTGAEIHSVFAEVYAYVPGKKEPIPHMEYEGDGTCDPPGWGG